MEARKQVQDLVKNNTIINSNMVSEVGQNLCKNHLICSPEYLNINKIQGELEAVIWLYIYQMIEKITPEDIWKEREKYKNYPRDDLRGYYEGISDKEIEFIISIKREGKYIKKITDILCPIKSKYLKGEYKCLMEKNEIEILDKIIKFSDTVKAMN